MATFNAGYHMAKTAKFSVVDKGDPTASGGAATSEPAADGEDIDALAAMVTKQGAKVKELKKAGKTGADLEEHIAELLRLRKQLEDAKAAEESANPEAKFDRKAFDDTLLRKMFVVPAFEIHGGVSGLFDLGPPGCTLKGNLVNEWKKHFILKENMLEMECTNLTPENVLKTSGHVDRFTDLMVKDVETGDCYRADKLLEDHIDDFLEKNPAMPSAEAEAHRRVQRQADAYSPEELGKILADYGIKATETGNALTEPFAFNLMFKTSIGPSGTQVGFLRPETAQGLFVNFRRLLDFNGSKMPFAAAQVGLGFRNEIAPKAGLLRVREFCMAEIEHFVDPNDKAHPSFAGLADKVLVLFSAGAQLGTGKALTMPIGAAVAEGVVNNETLGYFMTRTQLFMEKIGLDPARLRFRQHLATEMAHYAADCWDLEIKTSYGWIECVGHADRACYDLQVHAAKTGVNMEASKMLKEAVEKEVVEMEPNKKLIGKAFKQDQKAVYAALEALAADEAALAAFEKALTSAGSAAVGGFTLEKDMVAWKRKTKRIQEVKYLPSVIEPSFGIGRILHALLEHSFYCRDGGDEQRCVMRFKPNMAPLKVGVYPLQANEAFGPHCDRLQDAFTDLGLSSKVDSTSNAIGRKYARSDEVGTAYGVTVDFQTCEDDTVTLRERDTMAQIRVPLVKAAPLVRDLVEGRETWVSALTAYPVENWGEGPDAEAAKTAAVAAGAVVKS